LMITFTIVSHNEEKEDAIKTAYLLQDGNHPVK
jgi:hypothetical protein